MMKDELVCDGTLHPKAIEGLKLFNEKKFFEAHEELEDAWRQETGEIRDLFQGILQVAVAFLHQFDISSFRPITWNEKRVWTCDRCGTEMHEKNCKVTCPNCGNRFDCSDLNIYFD